MRELGQQFHHCKSVPSVLIAREADRLTLVPQGLITPPLVETTNFGAYVFFAVFCGAAFVFTFFCVPETSGRSLEDMDEVFGDGKAAVDGERKQLVLQQVRQEKKRGVAADKEITV